MNTTSSTTLAASTLVVATHAVVEARLSGIAAIRDQPSPVADLSLPPRFLRHCDEQTVLGVRAVLEAMAAYPGPRPSFERFGVIASPCGAGRIASAQTLAQLATRGTAAVSPHIVPQCSLHAMASAVSVAFGMHGPNIGTSGGSHALSEGLFTAFTLLEPTAVTANAGCDGIWLIVSEWDEEPLLDAAGAVLNDPLCRGLALAISSTADAATGRPAVGSTLLALHMHHESDARQQSDRRRRADEISSFARALAMCVAGGVLQSWTHSFPWDAEVRMVARDSIAAFRREAA